MGIRDLMGGGPLSDGQKLTVDWCEKLENGVPIDVRQLARDCMQHPSLAVAMGKTLASANTQDVPGAEELFCLLCTYLDEMTDSELKKQIN